MSELSDLRTCLHAAWRHTVSSRSAKNTGKRTRQPLRHMAAARPSQPASPGRWKENQPERERPPFPLRVKTVPCPFKSVWQKAHMIPELQSPIPSAKAASAFLSVWTPQLQSEGGNRQRIGHRKQICRNVTIQRCFSWRGGNRRERSYSGTPWSLEALDQNGRLQAAFLFIFCPISSSLQVAPLSRPIELDTLHHPYSLSRLLLSVSFCGL